MGVLEQLQGKPSHSAKNKSRKPAPPAGVKSSLLPKGGRDKISQVLNLGAFDWWFFAIILVLLGIGLIMVLSASGVVAERINGDKYYFFKRQLLFACAGGVGFWVAALMPRKTLYNFQYPALFLAFCLLALTLTPLAPTINGASRWLQFGGYSLQPMEFVKIALVFYLAYFMSSKQNHIKTFTRGVVPPFLVTGTLCFLLLLQPDFGSAVVLAALLFFMCIAGGTRFIYLFISVSITAAGAVYLAISAPYRMRRLTAFLDPFKDAQDSGYQLVQSLYALGSGGFWGVGVGASKQKMFYLPEAHNDFIMAVLGEEMGLVGITLVMALFAIFFWRCLYIVLGQKDLRDRFTAFGLSLIVALGAVLNLAVIMGAAPPKGVPMPLLSYGGSSMVATLLCLGLLMNFSRTAQRAAPTAKPVRSEKNTAVTITLPPVMDKVKARMQAVAAAVLAQKEKLQATKKTEK